MHTTTLFVQTMTPYYTTKNRPPMKSDGPYVIAWAIRHQRWFAWTRQEVEHHPDLFPYWYPCPPDPVSPEEAAFEICWDVITRKGYDKREEAKALWDAALSWGKTK
jgi:hypothetical protein